MKYVLGTPSLLQVKDVLGISSLLQVKYVLSISSLQEIYLLGKTLKVSLNVGVCVLYLAESLINSGTGVSPGGRLIKKCPRHRQCLSDTRLIAGIPW